MEITHDTLQLNPDDIKVGPIRKIYYGVPYDDYELNWVQQIKDEILAQQESFPEWVDDGVLLKAVEYTCGKVNKAVGPLKQLVHWRENEMPVEYEEVADLVEQNLMYCCGRDHKLRPVCVVNVQKLREIKPTEERLLRLVYYTQDKMMNDHFVRSKVETWVSIFDLANVSLTQIPMKQLKSLAKKLQLYFQSCMHKMFVINSPWMVQGIWKMVKVFIDKDTASKIGIYGKNNWQQPLLETVHLSELEEKYGGTKPNCDQ